MNIPNKAEAGDFEGRFREIISDPLNILIHRVAEAGCRMNNDMVRLHNGLLVALSGDFAYYQDFSRILLLNRGVHEPLEEYVFQEVLPHLGAAPVMLELGAYWGHYSMWLKLHRPAAMTVLVEPERAHLAVGYSNFVNNGYTGEFIQDFVGDGQFTIDSFAANRGLSHIDILHADIQGYEAEMLEGASRMLSAKAVEHLFISTHSQALHQAVNDILVFHGYRVEVSSDFDNETTSFDGLIYASNPQRPPLLGGFHPLGRRQIAVSRPMDVVDSLVQSLKRADLGASSL